MPKGIKKVVEELQDEIQEDTTSMEEKIEALEELERECTCGAKIDVSVLQAGETIDCECGVIHSL